MSVCVCVCERERERERDREKMKRHARVDENKKKWRKWKIIAGKRNKKLESKKKLLGERIKRKQNGWREKKRQRGWGGDTS